MTGRPAADGPAANVPTAGGAAGTGLIALDTVRMARLQGRLDQAAHRARAWALGVEEALGEAGWSAPGTVDALRGIGRWAGDARDDVRERIGRVVAIGGLPPTPLVLGSEAARAGWVGRQAARLRDLLADPDSPWARWVEVLAELGRAPSDALLVDVLTAVGGAEAARVGLAIEDAFRRDWIARRPWSPERETLPVPPPTADLASLLATQEGFAGLLARASRVVGQTGLGPQWLADFTGVDVESPVPSGGAGAADDLGDAGEVTHPRTGADGADGANGGEGGPDGSGDLLDRLRLAGYGLDFATAVANAVGARRVTVVTSMTGRVLGFVRFVASGGDGPEIDLRAEAVMAGLFDVAASVTFWVAGATGNPVAMVGTLALGAVFLGLSMLFSAAAEGDTERRRSPGPTYNPDTGETRHPSGGHQPRVTESGVPYEPGYVR